jgi:hypothetical protein
LRPKSSKSRSISSPNRRMKANGLGITFGAAVGAGGTISFAFPWPSVVFGLGASLTSVIASSSRQQKINPRPSVPGLRVLAAIRGWAPISAPIPGVGDHARSRAILSLAGEGALRSGKRARGRTHQGDHRLGPATLARRWGSPRSSRSNPGGLPIELAPRGNRTLPLGESPESIPQTPGWGRHGPAARAGPTLAEVLPSVRHWVEDRSARKKTHPCVAHGGAAIAG